MFEFPTYDRVPLIEAEGKVTVRSDPFRVVGIHDGFGSRTNGDLLFQLGIATVLSVSM